MRVNTLSFVVFIVEGTPLSLEVEHEKLLVPRHFMYQGCLNVGVRVRERAELLVLAAGSRLRAEFSLVLLNMVETFDLVVHVLAIQVRAVLERAKVNAIVVHGRTATLVQLSVVVGTVLWVVRLASLALNNFKSFQIQVLSALLVGLKKA